MSFNAAMLKQMRDEGLDLDACIRVLEAGEPAKSPAAVRQKRYRDNKRNVTRDVTPPPNERDNLTPQAQVSEPDGSSPEPRPWALPVGVSLQVWTDFLANRKRKKLGNTPTAWKAFNSDLANVAAQTGIPPPKLIEMCTAKGWGAIYDPRDEGHGKRSSSQRQPSGWETAYRANMGTG